MGAVNLSRGYRFTSGSHGFGRRGWFFGARWYRHEPNPDPRSKQASFRPRGDSLWEPLAGSQRRRTRRIHGAHTLDRRGWPHAIPEIATLAGAVGSLSPVARLEARVSTGTQPAGKSRDHGERFPCSRDSSDPHRCAAGQLLSSRTVGRRASEGQRRCRRLRGGSRCSRRRRRRGSRQRCLGLDRWHRRRGRSGK